MSERARSVVLGTSLGLILLAGTSRAQAEQVSAPPGATPATPASTPPPSTPTAATAGPGSAATAPGTSAVVTPGTSAVVTPGTSAVVTPGTSAAPGAPRPERSAIDQPGFAIGQRNLGIAAEIGFSTGLGAALHLGSPTLGLYVAGGVLPVFVFGNEKTSSRSMTFDAYGAAAVNADFYAMFLQPSPRSTVGVSGGYSYSTLLGSGANLGVAIRYDLATQLAFSAFGGLTIYPDAEDRLVEHGYPATQDPASPQIQGGVNVGLVFYP